MSNDDDDQPAVWALARAGDGPSFATLFRLHQARVYRRALALVTNVHDAEEITAAAFFELWRRRADVRVVEGTVLPWLLVTTVNLARNHRRGAGRYRAVIASLDREVAVNAESVAVSNIETELLGIRLTQALARLSATDAALLVLTALEGLNVTDAAAAVGVKPGAARMRLHRARSRLRSDLQFYRPQLSNSALEGDHA